MNKKERDSLICLLATPGIGRKTYRRVEEFIKKKQIPLSEVWEGKQSWIEIGFTTNQIKAIKDFQKRFETYGYLRYLARKDIRVITFFNKNYPKNLFNISDPPLILYTKGENIDQDMPSISVVGTRKITSYGKAVTKKIVKELVELNFQIVSGFMYGVDFQAHQTALDSGGKTVGVLGFGFDHFFPSNYQTKYHEMLKKGMTFITEYPPFTRPTHGSFPERNRIVAGLSLGTLVTEAAKGSGTMITSRLAGEYGRDVFAIPGSIFSEFSDGTKELINQGACLVTSGEDIARELDLLPKNKIPQLQKDIVEELRLGDVSFDYLRDLTQLDTRSLKINLSLMELSGLIVKNGEVWKIRL
jgi:DNA processing protein